MEEDDLSLYKQGLAELDMHDVDFIVMVCNTIHLHLETLQNCVRAPIVDLRELLKRDLEKRNLTKVTIIGTPSTISCGLYSFEGMQYVNPCLDDLHVLTSSIFEFNRGNNKEFQRERAMEIVQRCLDEGAEMPVFACTEFAVMFDGMMEGISTMDLLVEEVVRRCKR